MLFERPSLPVHAGGELLDSVGGELWGFPADCRLYIIYNGFIGYVLHLARGKMWFKVLVKREKLA